MKKFGNYVEGVSKQKLYKLGYNVFVDYWTDKHSQQNILTKFDLFDYVYTQKRDKTGLFHVIVYVKEDF